MKSTSHSDINSSKFDREFYEGFVVSIFISIDNRLKKLEEITPLTELKSRQLIHEVKGLFLQQCNVWIYGDDIGMFAATAAAAASHEKEKENQQQQQQQEAAA
jgi:hypothetical protein